MNDLKIENWGLKEIIENSKQPNGYLMKIV